jgi:ferrochelatase
LVKAQMTAVSEQLLKAQGSPLRVIFSAHGLPEKIIAAGDPYQDQIERSAAVIAAGLGLEDWRVSYQSRVGPMAWIGPSTIETLQEAGRDGVGVVVVPIAFVSEHSETLVELDLEYRDLARSAGVPLYLRAPAIGVDPDYIGALAAMVGEALKRNLCPGAGACKKPFRQCPFQATQHA